MLAKVFGGLFALFHIPKSLWVRGKCQQIAEWNSVIKRTGKTCVRSVAIQLVVAGRWRKQENSRACPVGWSEKAFFGKCNGFNVLKVA